MKENTSALEQEAQDLLTAAKRHSGLNDVLDHPFASQEEFFYTVTKATGIIVALAYTISGPIATPVVALIAIGALFFPDIFAPDTYGKLTRDVTGIVSPLIDQAQLQSAINLADAAMAANHYQCDLVTSDFKLWLETTDPAEKERKRQQLNHHYLSMRSIYRSQLIHDFTRADFSGSLVPQYVSSAARYLSILKTYYKYADDLQLPARIGSGTINSTASLPDLVLQLLRECIAEFSNTAIKSYKNGQNKILQGEGYPRTWDAFNDYRNVVTSTGLDMLPGFILSDPILYPTGCAAKYWNRRLVTFFDTYYKKEDGSAQRTDITRIESNYFLLRPVMSLKQISFYSGHFFSSAGHYVVKGLYASQCVLNSIDGYNFPHNLSITGEKHPGTYTRKVANIGTECFMLKGLYWNGTRPTLGPNGQLPLQAAGCTIASLDLLHATNADQSRTEHLHFAPASTPNDGSTSVFMQGIPLPYARLASYIPGKFENRLVDLDIFTLPPRQHGYLLSWRHKTALTDMLPEQNHVADQSQNRVTQFHLIKAGRDIKNRGLSLIKGPGFTGGDLVMLKGGQQASFYLQRNPSRWFNGSYSVRLWYVNLLGAGQSVSISILAVPSGNFASSRVSTTLQGSAIVSDTNNLNFSDLHHAHLNGTLLLPASLPGVTLTISNTSSSNAILLDRFELIFARWETLGDTIAVD